jgi:hypothetical protein
LHQFWIWELLKANNIFLHLLKKTSFSQSTDINLHHFFVISSVFLGSPYLVHTLNKLNQSTVNLKLSLLLRRPVDKYGHPPSIINVWTKKTSTLHYHCVDQIWWAYRLHGNRVTELITKM